MGGVWGAWRGWPGNPRKSRIWGLRLFPTPGLLVHQQPEHTWAVAWAAKLPEGVTPRPRKCQRSWEGEVVAGRGWGWATEALD